MESAVAEEVLQVPDRFCAGVDLHVGSPEVLEEEISCMLATWVTSELG